MLYEEKDFIEGCKLCLEILNARDSLMRAEDNTTKQGWAKTLQKSMVDYKESIPKRIRDQIGIIEESLEKYAQENLIFNKL